MKKNFFPLFISALIFFRLILPVWMGGFGPDEATMALRANQIIRCVPEPERMIPGLSAATTFKTLVKPCGELPVFGNKGRLGHFYGPYAVYLFTFLYWITSFNFGLLFLIISSLLILSAYLISKISIVHSDHQRWVFLLGLTSPLMFYFSLAPLLELVWLLIFSSLIVYLAFKDDKFRPIRELVIGLLLGIILGTHTQSIPLIIGFLVWRIFYFRRKKQIFYLFSGFLITAIPYVLPFIFALNEQSVRFSVGTTISPLLHILLTFTSIFKYFGNFPYLIINFFQPWKSMETWFSYISIGISFGLYILFCRYLYLKYKRRKSLDPLSQLIANILIAYFPLAWYTHAGSEPHTSLILWWITPLLIPLLVFRFLSESWAKVLLTFLIIFNIVTVFIQYRYRFIPGTASYNLGPSWREHKNTALNICRTVKEMKTPAYPVNVYIPYDGLNYPHLAHTLTAMTVIYHPECADLVNFTYDKKISRITVQADKEGKYLKTNITTAQN